MKKHNFNAGPSILPRVAIENAAKAILDFEGIGLSLLEISHRTKDFEAVNDEAEALFRELLHIPDNYKVLFLGGGASTQFSMVPMNFLPEGRTADYIVTGSWSQKALKEAKKIGSTHVAFDDSENNFHRVPQQEELQFSEDPVYVHMTTNNTIYGTEFHTIPQVNAPLVADMSSDIMARPIDAEKFSLIYAGAQKNLGPAGVTVVIIKKDFLDTAQEVNATMLKYATHAEKNSLYNTPPCFSIYMVNLVCQWILEQGGLKAMEAKNRRKAQYLYDAIDQSNGYYIGHAEKDSRSLMNVTFTMANSDLEKEFVAEGEAQGFIGIKGHRSVGGLRASIYNAMPEEGAKALAQFMADFQAKH